MLNLYSVRDKVAESFGPIAIMKNDDMAKRDFTVAFSESPTHGDYELYCIGRFDEETGVIEPVQLIKLMDGNTIGKENNE